ncbi:hypothetical protein A4D02_03140 [Niastella koreensis]|uniref:Glycosyl transferase group 1 n=2 Tax=Niastella koreensis TaxID=354356 RepID=G8TLD0_NIAKG|nr:glycosyltransferase family 1 protein [Niastella koreensis]AEW03003.1 glycosyl transferase group 1 [Niastella koreensis GR20-10]OQP55318.1 hypothetical protein A4D02_03140 [Niastella koreensis]
MENNRVNKPDVAFFLRKPRKVGNYSVEFIFEDVKERLKDKIKAYTFYSTYESAGLFKRLSNCIEAARRQKTVNHVTGDINYIGLLLSKKRTIHTILDCVFLNSTSGIKHKILKLFWLTIPLNRSAYVTAISQATKEEILKYKKNYPSDKIVVIPVAISDKFKRKDKPFNKSKPVILQVGAAHNKNIPRLIEALKGIECELHIVGKHNEEYEALLKQANIDYVYKWGLTDEEMIRKYEEADLLAFVSTYEGFGMPILEANAVGRPVVTANILSMPEVAADAACLVDPYDVSAIRQGILKVINDDIYRDTLVQKGFDNIRRFDPALIADEYLALYKKVVANQ